MGRKKYICIISSERETDKQTHTHRVAKNFLTQLISIFVKYLFGQIFGSWTSSEFFSTSSYTHSHKYVQDENDVWSSLLKKNETKQTNKTLIILYGDTYKFSLSTAKHTVAKIPP